MDKSWLISAHHLAAFAMVFIGLSACNKANFAAPEGDPNSQCASGTCASAGAQGDAAQDADADSSVDASLGVSTDAGGDAQPGAGPDGGDIGPVVCEAALADCDADPANGCETSLDTSANCGACGVVCTSQELCLGGSCSPAVATHQAYPSAIALDATHVYWTNAGTRDALGNWNQDGALMQAPIASGSASELVSNLSSANALVIDATHAYFVTEGGVINRTVLADGSTTSLATRPQLKGRIAIDATYVYWIEHGAIGTAGGLYRARKDNTVGPETLADTLDIEGDPLLTLDDAHLYWVYQDDIMVADKDGKNAVVLAGIGVTKGPQTFTVSDDVAYWNWADSQSVGVMSLAVSGGTAKTLANEPLGLNVSSLVVDAAGIYWAYMDHDSTAGTLLVGKKTPNSSKVVRRSKLLTFPVLAVNDTSIFIANQGSWTHADGTILRLPKP